MKEEKVLSTDPGCVVVAGDWHGNMRWAVSVIEAAAKVLEGEARKIILHAGDFGIWPGEVGERYLDAVISTCFAHDIRLWFVDGNHEDFTQLEAFRITDYDDKVVAWLPRGYRWQWHGRTWLAFGGAVSIDQGLRTKGKSWWPEEAITNSQVLETIVDGPADIVLAHDCPSSVNLSLPVPPREWLRFVPACEENRIRLQALLNDVKPRYLIHGHYHRGYQRIVSMPHGPVEITGLDMDGASFNWLVLNTRTMEWDVPGGRKGTQL
jgi:calcineurin-like phosphoesterase family protein